MAPDSNCLHQRADGVSSDMSSLEYVTMDAVADVILGFGLDKVDIRSAYRMVSVHPEDRWLLGMQWNGQLFVVTMLPFGLRSAPKLFTAVADAVESVAWHRGFDHLFHYLDNILLIFVAPVGPQSMMISNILWMITTRAGTSAV